MPTRFKRLTFRALSEGAVSESKAAELLSVPLHALDALMDVNPPNEADAANGG